MHHDRVDTEATHQPFSAADAEEAPESRSDRWLGQVIAGRYRVLDRLAAGGMGRVYVAEHLELETRVAIKILPIEDPSDLRVERFRREAQAASQLQSPHVARAFDYGRLPDGSFFLAMELLIGEDLCHLLAREGVLDHARTIAILRQVASALDAAHARGFIHRDLKPENIFIVSDLIYEVLVKVLDFGIAKQLASRGGGITTAGSVLGTPGYMAPEQVVGPGVSPQTDVYALGVVAFEMLTDQLPHPEGGLFEMLEALAKHPPRTPSEVGLHVEGLDPVMRKVLARDPSERYASAGAFVDDLERVLLVATSRPRTLAPLREPCREDDARQRATTLDAPVNPRPRGARSDATARWYVAAAITAALSIGFCVGAVFG